MVRKYLVLTSPQKEFSKVSRIKMHAGLTWIFAYLSLLEEASRSWGRLFEYLFVASSSLQGFVIFLFHVAYEKTAREFWLGNLVYKVLPTSRKRSFDQTMSKNTLSSTGQKTTST